MGSEGVARWHSETRLVSLALMDLRPKFRGVTCANARQVSNCLHYDEIVVLGRPDESCGRMYSGATAHHGAWTYGPDGSCG